MIFWDQYNNKIDEDEQDAKPDEGGTGSSGGGGDDNKEKKPEEVKKPASTPPKAAKSVAAAKSPESIDAEFEGFEEKSDTNLASATKPIPTAKPANSQNSSPTPKPPGRFKSLFNKGGASAAPKGIPTTGSGNGGGGTGGGGNDRKGGKEKSGIPNWSEDLFESVITQRNILFLFTIVCVVTIAMSVLLIRYVKTAQTIEPFVIEIEEKSGIPTVVTPVSTRVYSEDDAVKRYFIMKYIRAREEYFPSTFQDNFYNVVRVLSTPAIYYNDYRPKFSISNPNSPYNIYGESSNRRVVLKSLIFQSAKTAQVRIAFEVNGIMTLTQNKIILMDFDFANIEMNDGERFINPLGFQVTFYRIEDESS